MQAYYPYGRGQQELNRKQNQLVAMRRFWQHNSVDGLVIRIEHT
jgi:hypothetical protein